MARSKNSLLGKSHIHSEQQEEEKRTNNGHQIASMVMPRIINLRQELFGHPLAGIIYVQLHQVPHLAHNHSNHQLLSSDACEEEFPPSPPQWQKMEERYTELITKSKFLMRLFPCKKS